MDETLQTPKTDAPSQGEQALKEAEEHRASALNAIEATREDLGHVASRPVVIGGEVWTPRELEGERQHRQLQGSGSNETATKI